VADSLLRRAIDSNLHAQLFERVHRNAGTRSVLTNAQRFSSENSQVCQALRHLAHLVWPLTDVGQVINALSDHSLLCKKLDNTNQ
jgi:hypothetical protein